MNDTTDPKPYEPTPSARVLAVLDRVGETPYFVRTCETRALYNPACLGSCYAAHTPTEVLALLTHAAPTAVPLTGDAAAAVKAPAEGFRLDLPGLLGVVALGALDPSERIAWSDPKGTGRFTPMVARCHADAALAPDVQHSTIILGSHEGQEIVWTFHPGDPCVPSELDAGATSATTVAEALSLGATHAKVVRVLNVVRVLETRISTALALYVVRHGPVLALRAVLTGTKGLFASSVCGEELASLGSELRGVFGGPIYIEGPLDAFGLYGLRTREGSAPRLLGPDTKSRR